MADNAVQASKDRGAPGTAEHTRGGVYFTPRVDIYETDAELVVQADMPGIAPDAVELRYEGGELVLHGRLPARRHAGTPVLCEYEEGDFYRVFQIHESVDSTKIDAICKDGVLTIHLPKVEAARPRQVKVRAP